MKSEATVSNLNIQTGATHQHRAGQYSKVFDQRKRRIRGLWERNGAYYAQLTINDETTGRKTVRRVRMEDGDGNPVPTVAEAVKTMNKLKVRRDDNELSLVPKRTPILSEYACEYLKYCEALQNKTKNTLHRERTCINALSPVLGGLRLREINKAVVMRYMAGRKTEGKDLAEARESFRPLSESLIKYLADHEVKSKSYNEMFCPMANASWLQKVGDDTQNPYLGISMQQCGTLNETY